MRWGVSLVLIGLLACKTYGEETGSPGTLPDGGLQGSSDGGGAGVDGALQSDGGGSIDGGMCTNTEICVDFANKGDLDVIGKSTIQGDGALESTKGVLRATATAPPISGAEAAAFVSRELAARGQVTLSFDFRLERAGSELAAIMRVAQGKDETVLSVSNGSLLLAVNSSALSNALDTKLPLPDPNGWHHIRVDISPGTTILKLDSTPPAALELRFDRNVQSQLGLGLINLSPGDSDEPWTLEIDNVIVAK